jgi:Tol biopolymer transport system component
MMQGPGIAWSADGTEIFHRATGATCPPLRAVDIRDGSTRVVTDSVCAPSSLRRCADGTALFYQIIDQINDDYAQSRIYGVSSSGGSAEMHVDRVLPLYLPFLADRPTAMNTSFAVSADGSAIAYLTTGDSLYVHDVADRTTQVFATGYSGRGEVVAFSPDGSEIVHYSGYSGPVAMTSLIDGSTRTVWDQSRYPRGIRWHEGEIHILDITFEGHYYIWNVTTGQSRKIAELSDTPKTTWSADGSRVAAWVEGQCLAMQGDWVMGRCTAWQYTLHLIDTRSQSTVQIGQGNFGGGHDLRPGGLVFSPDGNRIAYVVWGRDVSTGSTSPGYGGKVYVKELP